MLLRYILKNKDPFYSKINSPHNMLPSLVLSNALALELRHGHMPAGHGNPLLFFILFSMGRPPKLVQYDALCWPAVAGLAYALHLQWPVTTIKVYLVLSPGCSSDRQAAKARQPCILYSILTRPRVLALGFVQPVCMASLKLCQLWLISRCRQQTCPNVQVPT
jgi:hypothetical protein